MRRVQGFCRTIYLVILSGRGLFRRFVVRARRQLGSADIFEREGRGLLPDPWGARDAYIAVISDRSPENVERWLAQHAARPLGPAECTRAFSLMEMQRALVHSR